jgi:ketosteroid isomerase-like protein
MLSAIRSDNDAGVVRSAVEAYFESWRSGDIDARAALFAADASFSDPVGAPSFDGLDAIRGFWVAASKAPVQMRPEVERLIVCGDEALVVFTMFLDTPGGVVGSLRVHERFVFNSKGQITLLQPFWDIDSVNRHQTS